MNKDMPTLKASAANYTGQKLGEVLLATTDLSRDQLEHALASQKEKHGRIGEILVAQKRINSIQLAKALALQLDLPFIESIDDEHIPDDLLQKLSIGFAKQNKIVPLLRSEHSLDIACSDPLDLQTQDEISMLFGVHLNIHVATPEMVLGTINKVYDRQVGQAQSAVADLEEGEAGDLKGALEEEVVDLLDIEGDDEAPIIRLVNSLLSQAVKDRASDIHIEPFEKELIVRFRVDGILYEIIRPPKRVQNSIISRIKIMAGLNIAEKRLPQDGRMRLKVAGRDFDIRVSSIPTSHGERIVMRLLDRSSVMRDLTYLGFSDKNLHIMEGLIKASHGIILVTGPTGSGKTSTLYACLAKINRPDLNILTVEDPVEYQLKGVGQVQVNPKIELTFATGLRAFLRQDPDVIMVGEIRDRETAEIAIQASLTGHLVLSTIHTNDAPGAITRLADMHVEPFLIASSLLAVLAQRLVRTICPSCRTSYIPTKEELAEIGLVPADAPELWRGTGCAKCQNTGYVGRLGIFELMLVDEELRNIILKSADAGTIRSKAREKGMISLREDGAEKVLAGITTIQEVTRVTREDVLNLSE